jgi:hypothetical protein
VSANGDTDLFGDLCFAGSRERLLTGDGDLLWECRIGDAFLGERRLCRGGENEGERRGERRRGDRDIDLRRVSRGDIRRRGENGERRRRGGDLNRGEYLGVYRLIGDLIRP